MELSETFDPKPIKKVYSRIGWSLCLIIVVLTAVQFLLSFILQAFWPDGCWLTDSSSGVWLMTFVPIYVIAMPAGILLMRTVPAQPPQPQKMGGKNFWIFLSIGFFLMYCGSFLGNTLSSLLSGGEAENALNEYAMDSNPIKILFMVVLAPLFEEYIFRKLLIDRAGVYSEKGAVFLSALTFGLFHTNLFQFFYAFLLGWVFAYVYIRTGKLRYSVLMHSIVNFMGSVVAPMIISMLDLDALANMDPNATEEQIMELYGSMAPGLLLYMLYLIFLLAISVTGLVFLIMRCRKLKWKEAQMPLPAGKHITTTYLNAGMLVFLILCTVMTVLSVLM